MAIKCGIAHRITHEMAETCGKQSVGRGGSMQEPRWWAAVDSNHLPPRYQHGALPVELAAQRPQEDRPQTIGVYWVVGFYKEASDRLTRQPRDRRLRLGPGPSGQMCGLHQGLASRKGRLPPPSSRGHMHGQADLGTDSRPLR